MTDGVAFHRHIDFLTRLMQIGSLTQHFLRNDKRGRKRCVRARARTHTHIHTRQAGRIYDIPAHSITEIHHIEMHDGAGRVGRATHITPFADAHDSSPHLLAQRMREVRVDCPRWVLACSILRLSAPCLPVRARGCRRCRRSRYRGWSPALARSPLRTGPGVRVWANARN